MASQQSGSTSPAATQTTGRAVWVPLALAALCTLVFTLDGSMNIIALPSIAEEFETSPAGAVWVAVALQFMILGLALPIGSLSTTFGLRRLFTIGLGVFLVGLVGAYLSPNLASLIVSRIVQGLGCALFLSTRNAIGTGGFPLEKRGMALGVIIAAVGIGAASGPLLGGRLIDSFGWRSIYVMVAPVALVTVTLSVFLLNREKRQRLVDFDLVGSALVFLGLGSLMIALNRTSDWGTTSPGIIALTTVGLVLIIWFVWHEGRVIKPVLDLALFRSTATVVTSLGLVFQVTGQSAATLVLPFLLVHSLELSSTTSGALFAIAPAFMFVGSTFGGRVTDRIGAGPIMVVGMVFQVVGVLLLVLVDETSSLSHIGWALGVMGTGSGMYQTSAGSAQMNAIPSGHIGTASALFIGLIMLAGSTGATLGGILMSASYNSGVTGALQSTLVADGYHTVAIAGTVILVVGLVNSLYYQLKIAPGAFRKAG